MLLRNRKTSTVEEALQFAFTILGTPKIMHGDQAGEFRALKNFFETHGIESRHSRPY